MILVRMFACVVLLVWTGSSPGQAGRATVAVAANFLTTARTLAARYHADTGDTVTLVHGSTGTLYAQILAGAPFDLFLAADSERPSLLWKAGLVAANGQMTYALGRLALVYRAEKPGRALADLLTARSRLAIANPALAPYGEAAAQVLQEVRGADWQHDLVLGQNVAQALAFVVTGNAPAGLVGQAQAAGRPAGIQVAEVPARLHAPIRQDAVLLARADANAAARAFFAFLASAEARAIIGGAGYEVPR